MPTQNTTFTPKSKSDKLTPDEVKAFKVFLRSHLSKTAAAKVINIDRQKLDRLLLNKYRSSPDTIEAIRRVLAA